MLLSVLVPVAVVVEIFISYPILHLFSLMPCYFVSNNYQAIYYSFSSLGELGTGLFQLHSFHLFSGLPRSRRPVGLCFRTCFCILSSRVSLNVLSVFLLALYSTFYSICVYCPKYSSRYVFLVSEVTTLSPQPTTWTARDYISSDPYPFTCLAWMTLPEVSAPAGIALLVVRVLKPQHDKVAVVEKASYIFTC
jgi:hypothetical protein